MLIELDTESLGTAPCARVMPRPQRLACLRFYCPAPSWLFQPCLCCLAVPFALGLPAHHALLVPVSALHGCQSPVGDICRVPHP